MRVKSLSLSLLLVAVLVPFAPQPVVDTVGAQALPLVPVPPEALQPGDRVVVGGTSCTLNFVYDGVGAFEGKVYLGTAAHCVGSVGQEARSGDVVFGKVAFIRDDCCTALDYAFIEVYPAFHDLVDPSLLGHPEFPTGQTGRGDTFAGDLLYLSGYGTIFAPTAATRHQRVAVLEWDTYTYYSLVGPIYNGDSGGPVVHESGKALGIISRGIPPAYEEGPTIEGMLTDSASFGFTVRLRSVS